MELGTRMTGPRSRTVVKCWVKVDRDTPSDRIVSGPVSRPFTPDFERFEPALSCRSLPEHRVAALLIRRTIALRFQ